MDTVKTLMPVRLGKLIYFDALYLFQFECLVPCAFFFLTIIFVLFAIHCQPHAPVAAGNQWMR